MGRRRTWFALAGAAVMALSVGMAEAGPGKGKGGGQGQKGRRDEDKGKGKGKQHDRRVLVVNGVVESLSDSGFVVARRGGKKNGENGGKNGLKVPVVTSPETLYRKSDGSEAAAGDVVVGVRVQVKGKKAQDGSVAAARVMIQVAEPEEE